MIELTAESERVFFKVLPGLMFLLEVQKQSGHLFLCLKVIQKMGVSEGGCFVFRVHVVTAWCANGLILWQVMPPLLNQLKTFLVSRNTAWNLQPFVFCSFTKWTNLCQTQVVGSRRKMCTRIIKYFSQNVLPKVNF